jgi:archaellum component FlaF (FlaF/FlaG flagellin family)
VIFLGIEIAVGMVIAAVALVVVLGSLASLILTGYKISTSNLNINVQDEIKITGAILESNNQTLLVNITNIGSNLIYDINQFDIIVEYNSTNKTQVVTLLQYNVSWFPIEIFVNSYSSPYISYNGILPGETLEIKINLPNQANRNYPLVIVVSPLKGIEATYTY